MKILMWAIGAVIAILVVMQFVPVSRTNPPVTREVKWNSPATQALAERACYDCHSNKTVWPWTASIAPLSWLVVSDVNEGRDKLNFSQWDRPNLEAGERGEGNEAGETVTDGSMPPASYLLMHPDAKLTPAERETLAAGLDETLRNDPPVQGQGREER